MVESTIIHIDTRAYRRMRSPWQVNCCCREGSGSEHLTQAADGIRKSRLMWAPRSFTRSRNWVR